MDNEETQKKEDANLREWLLSFAKQAKTPVVISLLVDQQQISFLQCSKKDLFLDGMLNSIDFEEGESPSGAAGKTKGITTAFKHDSYIGWKKMQNEEDEDEEEDGWQPIEAARDTMFQEWCGANGAK